MKKAGILMLFFVSLFFAGPAPAAEQQIFGPMKYDVKERYGKENRYQAAFKATEGLYVIKLQNGEQMRERSDIFELSVNGEKLLKEDTYEYRFIACIVKLKKENTFELVLKDFTPSGFKRPPALPKNVSITVIPVSIELPGVVLGLVAWEGLKDYSNVILKIKAPDSAALARSAASLQNTVATRADAVRKLSDRKDPLARDFILYLFNDYAEKADIKGEAAMALGVLGDKAFIPVLMQGLQAPEEKIRIGSARALSLYKEEDTKDLLAKTLSSLDFMRTTPVVRSIVSAGWRPISTLIGLAESTDASIANLGVELLTGSGDPRVVGLLLSYLEKPGSRDMRLIITALGASKDLRAKEALSALAGDPVKRKGLEGELGMALVNFNDPKSADLIVEMIKKVETRSGHAKLLEAYKNLTNKEYK